MSKLYGLALITVCCILTVTATVSSEVIYDGEHSYDLHGDLIYPGAEEFDGIIDGFEANGVKENIIVINDTIYSLHSDAIFRNRTGGRTGLSSFKVGMMIKFYALENMLTKMWDTGEVEESMVDEGPATSPEQPASEDQIRQVDGVWTN